MPQWLMVSLRAVLGFVLLLTLTRIMGRKMMSQLTFFDYVVGITLGTVTGSFILGTKYTSISAAAVLIVFTGLLISTGWFSTKSFFIRKWVNGEPVVLIENGHIVEQSMKQTRLTLDTLMMKLRDKSIFNIHDVEFAVFEMDGKISVLPKSQKQPITPSDLSVPTGYSGLMKNVIMDGEVLEENLTEVQLDMEWLQKQLLARGFDSPEQVFYAGLDTSGRLYISRKIPDIIENHYH